MVGVMCRNWIIGDYLVWGELDKFWEGKGVGCCIIRMVLWGYWYCGFLVGGMLWGVCFYW